MGDENPIHTLEDYSKPSHKGYRNTIELPVGNNVAPLRSDTFQLKHGLVSRTYYKKSLIMASTFGSKSKFFMTMPIPSQGEPLTNWSVVSFMTKTSKNPSFVCSNHVQGLINAITIHSKKQSDSYDEKAKENEEEEKGNLKNIHINPSMPPDLSIEFITKKSLNSIHSLNRLDWLLNHPTPRRRRLDHRENTNRGVSNFTGRIKGMHVFVGNFTYVIDFMIVEDISSIIDPRDYSKPSHKGYRNTIKLLVGNNVAPLRSNTIQLVQNGCSFHGLRSEDPNQHLKDFLRLVDSLDLDGENRKRMLLRLFQFSLRDQANNWLEHLLAGSITTREDLTTRFLAQFFPLRRTTKLHNDILMFQQHQEESLSEAWTRSINAITIHFKKQSDSYDEKAKENEEEEKGRPKNIHINPSMLPDPSVAFITKNFSNSIQSLNCLGWFLNHPTSSEGESEEERSTTTDGVGAEYFDIFPTRSELAYHKYLMCGLILSIFQRNPIITERCPSNLKIPCNIRHVHVERAYTDPKSPLNIMTRMMYNWIMRIQIVPRQNTNEGVCNFTGRIKGMHVIVGNFTYVIDFMIIEDISSIIDPRLSQVVLRRPFVEISNMTHDPPKGVVRFTNRNDEVSYKMPHKIEQYNSLSNLEKEHTKLVYLRNEEDKRRGV
uniref:Retrotransposon Orf1 n=1 Tax=Tanacetum cinerariifolium TaxID=118510 RepID=A0A6L2NSS3_TANCI|nr:retrotransposon Orf1 [Tanacetum cinerariifolium]